MITKTRVIESVACLATAAALTGLPAWSQAGEPDTSQKMVVSYAGLDLNSPAGARILYSRLLQAAYSVCDYPQRADLRPLLPSNICIRKALGDAVTTVNRTQLTQLYIAHYHSPPAGSGLGISGARVAQK
jgi:UrcA family protein